MLMNQTIDKLNHMKFFGMVKGLEEQAANPEAGALSFEERMSLLVDRELTDRDDRRLGLVHDRGLQRRRVLRHGLGCHGAARLQGHGVRGFARRAGIRRLKSRLGDT